MTQQVKAEPAILQGEARRISAAEKAVIEAAIAASITALAARPAVLRATIHVTRAATGKVDTYELVGTEAGEPEPTTGA